MTTNSTVTMSRELADRVEQALGEIGKHDHLADYAMVSIVKKELRALLDESQVEHAAPTVEADGMGEAGAPFGVWRVPKGLPLQGLFLPWDDATAEHVNHESVREVFDFTKLYASPPAPVSVDERAEFDKYTVRTGRVVGYSVWREDFAIWQARACLDKVKELNQ